MRTILDSVRLIDKKLGGTVEADEGMRSLLDEIATLFHSGGGGSDLPPVTASDDGKFLRVVSGAWAAATVPAAKGASF